jgi:endonuclease/exonuclease/phosphatase (EEP) superfamily protein YafD
VFERFRNREMATVRNASRQHADQPDRGFTVLSFNVGNGLADPARLVEYLGDEQADVVGIQELSLQQAEAIERRLMGVYPYRLLMPTGFSGKGLISKLPIRSSASIAFAPDRPDLNVSIDVFEAIVQVIVAHPKPPKVGLSGVVFDPVTDSQIMQVAELAISDSPSVILGDFNMTERQAHHGHMTSSGLIDAFQETGARGASFPRRLGHTHRVGSRVDKMPLRPVIRIDYVWYTAELVATKVWVGDDAGSDHLPVLARLEWRKTGQPGS